MPVCLTCDIPLDEMNCCPICHQSYTRPYVDTSLAPPMEKDDSYGEPLE